jgi:sulfur-oxidizing protein SoxY
MTTTTITATWSYEPIATRAPQLAQRPCLSLGPSTGLMASPADSRRGGERQREDLALEKTMPLGFTRRTVLTAAITGSAGFASAAFAAPPPPGDATAELIKQLTGKTPTASDRLHLVMPRVFPNGYTVPLTLVIDSPMTESDHVRHVSVLAPRNPLVEVATFHFVPQRSEPRVSTRIRLAEPQYVLAVAEMNDGTLLMTETWVEVATNGCK